MKVIFGLIVNLVQVTSKDAHTSLYLTTIVFICLAIVQYELQPLKFNDANRVDLSFQAAVIIFLIVATSFIDYAEIGSDVLEDNRSYYGYLGLSVLSFAVFLAFCYFLRWLITSYCRAAGANLGRRANIIFQFRDVMAVQASLDCLDNADSWVAWADSLDSLQLGQFSQLGKLRRIARNRKTRQSTPPTQPNQLSQLRRTA